MPLSLMALLVDACLRATPLLAAAWLLTSLMRRTSAATRHYLWACAIAGAALIPIAAAFTPRWQIPAPPVVRSLSSLSSLMAPESGSIARRDNVHAAPAIPAPGPAPGARWQQPPRVPSARGATEDRDDRIVAAIAIAWVAGTLAIMVYLALGTLAAWRLRRVALPIVAPWVDAARAMAGTVGVRRVQCLESSTVRTPMVCGLWRPAIVMPLDAARWPDDRLRAVILHELAHITRRDCFTQLFARVVCALYWVNPLVWVAARRLRAERERACDDVVLAAGMKGSDYAGHLLAIATAARPRASRLATVGLTMAHCQQLEGRLMAILNPSIRRSSARSARLIAAAAVVVMSASVSAVRLETAATGSTAPAMTWAFDQSPSAPVPASIPDATRSVARVAGPPSTTAPDAVATINHAGQPTAAHEAIEGISLRAQAQVQPRTFLLIVDDLHLMFRTTPKLRELAARLVRQLVRDGDLCGVVSTGTSDISVAPTSESTACERAIPRMVGNALKLSEIRDASWALLGEQEMRHRAAVASSTAANAIDAAAAGQSGRPLVVLFLSSGYDVRVAAAPTELIQTAVRANAVVYTIDPRGFVNPVLDPRVTQADWDADVEATRGSLGALANQTKGMAVFTQEDLDALLLRLGRAGQ